MLRSFFKRLMALSLLLVFTFNANAWDVYTSSFASGNWWQEVGYAGVGNKNEVLAVAEVTTPVLSPQTTTTTTGSGNNARTTTTEITPTGNLSLTVGAKLLGVATESTHVSCVKLWARKYDTTRPFTVTGSSDVPKTFAYPFDYRDPVGKSGAILLAEIRKIPADGIVSFVVEDLDISDQLVLYVTADVVAFDTNNLSLLPLLKDEKTELGANFTSISFGYKASKTVTVTDKNKKVVEGPTTTTVDENSVVNLTRQGKPANLAPNGSRVLVPKRQVIYTPDDFYSKYYRIPCLAKASDGSLIAISDARKYHIHDIANDIDMLARRSTDGGKTWSLPITIAKGSGGHEGMSTAECDQTHGYGDAAIAALPNGDLIVTMIYGNKLRGESSTYKTQNAYCISHDNGVSWSQPKTIPENVYVINGHTQERGCIAPGNMCVVKEGALAGKVLACFRSYDYAPSGSGANAQYNIFLLYDPTTDSWSRLSVNNSNYYKIGGDDEAHLVEVGPNSFLMSIRQSSRVFAHVTYNESSNTLSASQISYNGMTLGTPCNGDVIGYTTKKGNRYQVHALPVRTQPAITNTSENGRNGLMLFYSQYDGGNTLNVTQTTCLSDPYDNNTYRKETAQYSSLTTLSDGTIGVFFEEYPQVIRVATGDQCWGDYLMEDVYMNLRIGDIIPNEEAPEAPQLIAPRITPTDRSYDSHDAEDRPNPITIYNDNEVDGVTTHYTIYFYDKDGHQAATSISGDFTGSSVALDWSTLTMGNQSLEDLVKDKLYPGVSIRVIAYCTKTGYKDSESVAQPYLFSTPVRNIKIVAKPVSGWGQPFISAFNIGTYEQGEVMVASVGATLVANGTPVYPYTFEGFSFNGDHYVDIREGLTTAQLQALNIQDIHDYQITMTVPYDYQFADNGDNEIVIYAWYEAGDYYGAKTRVYSNFYTATETLPNGTQYPLYDHNDWYPNLAMAGDDFPEPSPELIFDNVTKNLNTSTSSLEYNLDGIKCGLDLNVNIMSDNRSMMDYNAIVMVKNITTNEYVKVPAPASKAGKSNAPTAGSVMYYLVQGLNSGFSENSAVYSNAADVFEWYTVENGVTMPKLVEGMNFSKVIPAGLDNSGAEQNNTQNFNVEIYIVKGNSLTDVSALSNAANYKTLIIHTARNNKNIPTAVTDNVATREVKSVRYYNIAGVQSNEPFKGINIIVTEYTDGTRSASKAIK